MSSEVVPSTGTDLLQSDAAQALADEIKGDIGADDLALPIIKLTQGLSKEVSNGEAVAGEFLNSVTKFNHGTEFDLVFAGRFQGRFYSPPDSGASFVAGPEDVVPASWPTEYAGQRFSELPDAEERFKDDVNSGAREWGSGPPISTTFNYVGFVLEFPDLPVRVSLMRSSAPAHKVINTLLKTYPQPWAYTINFTRSVKSNAKGDSFVWQARQGDPVPTELQQKAVDLAVAFKSANIVQVGDGDEPTEPRKPREGGAVSVS